MLNCEKYMNKIGIMLDIIPIFSYNALRATGSTLHILQRRIASGLMKEYSWFMRL